MTIERGDAMKRRSFFGAALAAVAGLFGVKAFGAGPKPGRVPPTERDENGECLARLYRLGDGGCFHEIPRDGARPGDRVIMLGIDGARIWKAEAFTVEKEGYVRCTDGRIGLAFKDDRSLFGG